MELDPLRDVCVVTLNISYSRYLTNGEYSLKRLSASHTTRCMSPPSTCLHLLSSISSRSTIFTYTPP
jgi:hypothetical protein